MSVEVVDSPKATALSNTAWPLKVRSRKPAAGVRIIRIGILGLGRVGQAVARLAADRSATAHAGIRFHVDHALVRDVEKARHCPPPRITSNPDVFLCGRYDVVVEALDTVEPARTMVAQLLERGTSVVTANKALVAGHRDELESIAASFGAAFRYEATALSAIPFLGTLADRPLVASVDRVRAIVNGTSNFILTTLAGGEASFDQALARAQQLGFAEPDASRDLDGDDAADKLVLLTALFGWGRLSREALEVSGIRSLTTGDLAAARSIGGTIKPIVSAERDSSGVRAFVGPALLEATEPLASISGELNGIRLDGRHVQNLFFSGPGAGPDVTAATLLDDAIQAAGPIRCQTPNRVSGAIQAAGPIRCQTPNRVSGAIRGLAPNRVSGQAYPVAPVTPWFLRATCPGVLPSAAAIARIVSATGLPVERVADYASDNTRWIGIGSQNRHDVDAAIAKLFSTHRIGASAIRRL